VTRDWIQLYRSVVVELGPQRTPLEQCWVAFVVIVSGRWTEHDGTRRNINECWAEALHDWNHIMIIHILSQSLTHTRRDTRTHTCIRPQLVRRSPTASVCVCVCVCICILICICICTCTLMYMYTIHTCICRSAVRTCQPLI
jgi:hypothetical protein